MCHRQEGTGEAVDIYSRAWRESRWKEARFKHKSQGTPQFTEQLEEEESVIEIWVVRNVDKEPTVHFSSADLWGVGGMSVDRVIVE